MYHIKNDKRAHNSARLISEGLAECLKRKEFDKISISDIQKQSSVSRATFYRLFDNIQDVIDYQCDSFFLEFLNTHAPSISKFSDLLPALTAYLVEHAEYFELLRQNNSLRCLYKSHNKLQHETTSFLDLPIQSETEMDYYNTLFITIITSISIVWTEHKGKDSPELLSKIIHNVLNPVFFE